MAIRQLIASFTIMKSFILTVFLLSASVCLAQGKTNEVVIPKGMFDESRDSTYYRTYQKLKELYVAKMFTPQHKDTKKLNDAFRDKLRSDDGVFPSGIGAKYPNALEWLKDGNLEKTQFKSFEEAQADYDRIIAVARLEDAAIPEYSEYSAAAILKYGPQIFIDLVFEVMMEYPDQ